MLYHYTSAAGLRGIIQSDRIWASSYLFKNDALEVKFGITAFAKWAIENLEDRNFATSIDPNYFGLYLSDVINTVAHPFTCSVCQHEQSFEMENGLLSQWRAYGEGGGYCIVFDRDGFVSKSVAFAERHVDSGHTQKLSWAMSGGCSYSDTLEPDYQDEFKSILDELVNGIVTNTFPKIQDNEAKLAFAKSATNAGIFCKHPGFSEEKEVRFAYGASKNVIPPNFSSFVRNGSIVPTIELFGDDGIRDAITSIIIGPHELAEERAVAVDLLCRVNGLEHVEIRISKTPLRP